MYKICQFFDKCSREEISDCGGILCGEDVYYNDIFSKVTLEGMICEVLSRLEYWI